MSAVTPAMFTCPLGDGAALIPRTAAIAEAHQALLMANYERLAHWDPGFGADHPTTFDETRSRLEQQGQAWLEGTQLPLDIAVLAGRDWRLVGHLPGCAPAPNERPHRDGPAPAPHRTRYEMKLAA